jgi:hypothetical protein
MHPPDGRFPFPRLSPAKPAAGILVDYAVIVFGELLQQQ